MKTTEDIAYEYIQRTRFAVVLPEGYELIRDPFEKVRNDDLKYNSKSEWAEVGGSDGLCALAFYLVARKITV